MICRGLCATLRPQGAYPLIAFASLGTSPEGRRNFVLPPGGPAGPQGLAEEGVFSLCSEPEHIEPSHLSRDTTPPGGPAGPQGLAEEGVFKPGSEQNTLHRRTYRAMQTLGMK